MCTYTLGSRLGTCRRSLKCSVFLGSAAFIGETYLKNSVLLLGLSSLKFAVSTCRPHNASTRRSDNQLKFKTYMCEVLTVTNSLVQADHPSTTT